VIEKLKDKKYVRAFGLMSPEEQELLRKANTSNCLFYNPGGNWLTIRCDMDFDRDRTYAIKPDYQPEPEYVDLEIVEGKDGFLGVYNKEPIPMTNFPFVHIHCLLSLPNFKGFYIKGSDNVEVEPQWVARHDNVIARFRSA
jgi:hypothetical protein